MKGHAESSEFIAVTTCAIEERFEALLDRTAEHLMVSGVARSAWPGAFASHCRVEAEWERLLKAG